MLRHFLFASLLVGQTAWKTQQSNGGESSCGGASDARDLPDAAASVPAVDATAPLPPSQGDTMPPVRTSGDIEGYLKAITYGGKNDQAWMPPAASTVETFAGAFQSLLLGDIDSAHAQSEQIGFLLLEYTDPQQGTFYILRDMPTEQNQSVGGTYVWNPEARLPLVVEVPHPAYDSGTNDQGIELFLAAEASLLLLSGTHRASDIMPSTCQHSNKRDYRRSDPAHSVDHLFHLAHVQTENTLDQPLFLQLHGFGEKAYEKLKKQCSHMPPGSDPELLINISDGFPGRGRGGGGPPDGGFARLLAEAVNDNGVIKACVFQRDTRIYGGTRNVQGRYTNASPKPCKKRGKQNSGRFIHVEQSYNTRHNQRDLMRVLILDALDRYYDQVAGRQPDPGSLASVAG